MKKISVLILTAVLACGAFTGCTKASGAEAEVHGDNSFNAASVPVSIDIPDTFEGEWTGLNGLIKVRADADVVYPEEIPGGAEISKGCFTQEDADRLLDVLMQGKKLYKLPGTGSAEIKEQLDLYRAMERGDIPVKLDGDKGAEYLPEIIESWEKALEDALDAEENPRPASMQFEKRNSDLELIEGTAKLSDGEYVIHIRNGSDFIDDEVLFYRRGFGDSMTVYSNPCSPDEDNMKVCVNPDKAEKEAAKVLSALRLDDMVCVEKLPVCYAENNIVFENEAGAGDYESAILGTGYELSFLRGINGIPIETGGYSGASVPEDTAYSGFWSYERIEIGVDEKGIVSFRWVSPYTDISVDRSNTELLPFEDIKNIFSKMIMVVNGGIEKQNQCNGIQHSIEFDIDRASLNLARVRDKEDIQNGRVIPVWDFYGEVHNFYDGKEAETEYGVVLTIDAETGNVIDRQTGI